MPDIAPFHGLHFDPAAVDLGRALAPGDDRDPRRLFDEGGPALLDRWLADGTVVRDPSRSLYRYVQIGAPASDGRPLVRRGLIAAVRLSPYGEARTQPHLRTVERARDRQLALLRATQLHATPITALYADAAGEVERLLRQVERERPLLEVTTGDGVHHQLWRTSSAELIGKLRRALGPKKLLLGDGHHRYEAMLAWQAEQAARAGAAGLAQYSAAQYATMALYEQADPGLASLPANRLLVGAVAVDHAALLERAREYFLVDPVPGGGRDPAAVDDALAAAYGHQPAFVVALGGPDAWRFTLAPHVNLAALGIAGHPAVQRLEVTLVRAIVCERILGIAPAALDAGEHLRYPPTTAAALAAVGQGDVHAAFCVPAVRLDVIRHVVEVGDVMPARATRLGPAVATGVVMRRLDVDEDLI